MYSTSVVFIRTKLSSSFNRAFRLSRQPVETGALLNICRTERKPARSRRMTQCCWGTGQRSVFWFCRNQVSGTAFVRRDSHPETISFKPPYNSSIPALTFAYTVALSLGKTKVFSSYWCPTRPPSPINAVGAMGLSSCTIWMVV